MLMFGEATAAIRGRGREWVKGGEKKGGENMIAGLEQGVLALSLELSVP
jgi:hypothetical protein